MRVYACAPISARNATDQRGCSLVSPKSGERFCAVADGMGGHLAGEVASGMAIDAVRKMAARHKQAFHRPDQKDGARRAQAGRLSARRRGNDRMRGHGHDASRCCAAANGLHLYRACRRQPHLSACATARMEQRDAWIIPSSSELVRCRAFITAERGQDAPPAQLSSPARSARLRRTTPPICWRLDLQPRRRAFCSAPTA